MRRSLAAVLLLATPAVFAQLQLFPQDPDWKESEAPPPPALATTRLVEVDVPRSTLRYGVDPASVSVGRDGIVRYVVVASAPGGAVTGLYEAIHCKNATVKLYARHNPDTGWTPLKDPDWRPLHDARTPRHSLVIARTGACLGHAANRSGEQIVRDLRAPVDKRFE